MFDVRTDRPLLPPGPAARLIQVRLRVPRPATSGTRKPVHLSVVIDRSGSMSGDKLRLALHAARQAVRALDAGDRFSVVTFDHRVTVPVPSTEATPAARARAEAALEGVTADGNTDLGGGWLRGCEEIAAHLPEDAVGRCLLITDGQANHGITAPDELARRAQEQRLRRRVTTSTLGLGDGFNEFLLGRLSEQGGGSFYFAERADQIPGFVAQELGDVLSVVARGATLTIEVSPGVAVDSLNDYPCTIKGSQFSFLLGSLAGGDTLTPIFRLRFPGGPLGETHPAFVRLVDQDGALPTDPQRLVWVRVGAEQALAQAADPEVTRPAASFDAARARRGALELNRDGLWSEASAHLAQMATSLRDYAAGDAEVLAHAAELDAERQAYAQPMTQMSRKERYYRAMLEQKMRASAASRPASSEPRVLAVPAFPEAVPLLQRAVGALAGRKGAPVFAVEAPLSRSFPPVALTAETEQQLVAALAGYGDSDLKVAFVRQMHEDSWFSHWHPRERTAVISLWGVSQLISSPVEAFVAYELLLYGLAALSSSYDAKGMLHQETRACLFDLCQNKADVKIKLQAGHVCADCLKRLSALGMDGDAVLGTWRAVQKLAQAEP